MGYPGAGNILIFNNGSGRDYSSIEEIEPPVDGEGNYSSTPGVPFGPDETTWTYVGEVPENFYAMNVSGAHRFPNGNTLICDGPHGTFFEVTMEGDTAWYYINPVTNPEICIPTSSPNAPRNCAASLIRLTSGNMPVSFPHFHPLSPVVLIPSTRHL